MKIIHLADVHLGASNKKLAASLQKELKNENANRLKNVFDYAKKIDAKAIIISGDLFHSKNPINQHVNFFVDMVKSVGVPVFYVKGNHDESFLFADNIKPDNLYIFGNDFDGFELDGNVSIFGQSGNKLDIINLDRNKFNIVMLHGDIYSKGNDFIDISDCKNRNINYLALGHLHTFESEKLDGRGQYCYSGCLTGNGFDECGEKGFVVLDTETGKFEFKKIEGRQFAICEIDITGFEDFDDLCERIENATAKCGQSDIVRAVLTGFYEEEQDKFASLIEGKFSKKFDYFELVDKSKMKIDKEKLKGEVLSFKAEFLRLVTELDEFSEEDKNTICEIGINALRGDDV